MKTLVFATNNEHKLKEVQSLLGDNWKIVGLKQIGCSEDIPETKPTIEGNAIQKAQYIYEHYGYECFADDTGLEIDALKGEPGVYSARYAGPDRDAEANMNKVLHKMTHVKNRNASFKTVMALRMKSGLKTFTGICEGQITERKTGDYGFGYDPIFQPMGQHLTFAEMPLAEKNAISHRSLAIRELIKHLNDI